MKISLKDVLSFGGLLHADVLAGKEKLNSVFIESVTTIEVTDHLIGDWVKENQLCVTTTNKFSKNIEREKMCSISCMSCRYLDRTFRQIFYFFLSRAGFTFDKTRYANFLFRYFKSTYLSTYE